MAFNSVSDYSMNPDTWVSFKSGNWNAYVELYNTHFKILNNYGHKFTNNTELIEDAVHDLFVELWSKRTKLGNPISVRNYLYKSLRNLLFRKMEKQKRFVLVGENADYPFHFEASSDTIFIENESEQILQSKIKTVIQSLPSRQQEIIYLRFYEGLDYEEIADIMGLNKTSAYKLLYKAINKLQENVKAGDLFVFLTLLLLKKSSLVIN
nr:sigma-70 family RNA polymerase sigma factor [Pedobacter panaciterrae]